MAYSDLLGEDATPEHVVVAYHERTKHHFHRYAASPGYMDWATQPDPFRRFAGAELCPLPMPLTGQPLRYAQLYAAEGVPAEVLSINSVARLLRYSLSLTAWKSFNDTTWPLRANPSSGNLHPTEGYVALPALAGLGDAAAVYHYAPREHALERRVVLDAGAWRDAFASLPAGSFVVGLSSIHWREAWKYGERAFRYCQHDVGHALAALRIAAAAQGWHLTLLADVPSPTIARFLGLDRAADFAGAEPEEPELLAMVTPGPLPTQPAFDLHAFDDGDPCWNGRANALSRAHGVEWPVIDEVAVASRRLNAVSIDEPSAQRSRVDARVAPSIDGAGRTAEQVILGRRSAVAMDGLTSISQDTFFGMLARLMPTGEPRSMPWDAVPWRPRIHLALFVHRVDGLPPGLYALPRDESKVATLQAMMRPEFQWQRPAACPPWLPLFQLQEGDCRGLAAGVSCGQSIAGDGAFSLGMIADFTDSLVQYGAPFYRNLFWEAGMVGQVLYLEAEGAGVRATGIGCYFDDAVHDVFGITARGWQSFYHFTVGGPVEDGRLTTLPAYVTERDR